MTSWIDLAGWALVHFVWQGAVIAGAAAAGLRLLRRASPQARYALACGALVAMLTAPLLTIGLLAAGAPIEVTRWTSLVAGTPAGDTPFPAASPERPAPEDSLASALDPVLPTIDAAAAMPFIVTLWLSGVACLLARLAGGCWRVRCLRRAALGEPVSRWQALADALAHRLRLARPVFIVDSVHVDTPTVLGWIRPVILLPIAALSTLTTAQVEAILAHELAHVRRHDFAVNALQTLAETLLFYHPAVWWISSRIRAEREHCCDDVAVQVCGDPVAYAEALTELAAWQVERMQLAMTATGASLIARVRRLLNVPAAGAPRRSSGMLLAGTAIVVLLVAGTARAISLAQPADDAPPDGSPRFGPPEINQLLGFELFPAPKAWATDDPRGARAWGVRIDFASGPMPLVGFTGRSLIRHAYDVVGMPIVDAPGWLDDESFDLSVASESAIVNGIVDAEAFRTALRQLVEQQLGLVVRRETREFPVYALVRAHPGGALGSSITPSVAACWDGQAKPPIASPGLRARELGLRFCGIEDGFTGIRAERVTMTELAAEMRRRHPIRPDRPVVDRTELDGAYDFTVTLGPLPLAAIGAGHPAVGTLLAPFGIRNLYTALPEQLGLRLVESTAPFEVLVIDRIQRPVRQFAVWGGSGEAAPPSSTPYADHQLARVGRVRAADPPSRDRPPFRRARSRT